MQQLFENGSGEEILAALEAALGRSDESPFWAEKAPALARAVLSVLLPLRAQQLLFTPEGDTVTALTPALFLRWCDLVCLKHLAFTLQHSNDSGALERTRYSADRSAAYRPIDLERLGSYLSGYSVDLRNELADFPITHYNLHIGITDVLRKLL
jgi:hypothetical protein